MITNAAKSLTQIISSLLERRSPAAADSLYSEISSEAPLDDVAA